MKVKTLNVFHRISEKTYLPRLMDGKMKDGQKLMLENVLSLRSAITKADHSEDLRKWEK
jgi:hypothetical protein